MQQEVWQTFPRGEPARLLDCRVPDPGRRAGRPARLPPKDPLPGGGPCLGSNQENAIMSTDPTNTRETAIKRLKARRDFGMHVVTYIAFNGEMMLVWYVTGHGYFWPGWLLGLWGAGLLVHAWDVWGHRQITEADIRREMERQSGGHA